MSFADHGINGRVETKDGKKFFDVEKVSLEEIVKDPITVLEYEEGVKTQYGPGRIVVKIIHNGAEKENHHQFVHDKINAQTSKGDESIPNRDKGFEETHRERALGFLF